MYRAAYIGIDLAASEKRCTGFAALTEEFSGRIVLRRATCIFGDIDIVNEVLYFRNYVSSKVIIAIDAPLSNAVKFREVDRRMISLGFRVFPPTFKWMKVLTIRGTRLARELAKRGLKVIETHPRSVLLSSGCASLCELVQQLGLETRETDLRNEHIRDALLAAIAALCYVKRCGKAIEASDGCIWILERVCSEATRPRSP